VLLSIITSPFAESVYGAQASLGARRQQDQLIQREEERQKLLQEQFREHRAPSSPEEKGDSEVLDSKAPKMIFRKIELEGAYLLDEEEQKGILKNFIGKPIPLSQVNEILRLITNYYVERGYLTTRAYLPPQDLRSGLLKIKVIEGTIDTLTIRNQKNAVEKRLHVMPTQAGEVANIRDLEQGIDQINRMPSYDAKMMLEPGDKIGGSHVVINTTQQYPFSCNASMDNYGMKSTGRSQGEVQLTLDDVLHLYDSWSLNLRKNMDLEEDLHHSRSLTLQGSIPYGYWTIRYAGSYFQYLSTVTGQLQNFRFSGNSMSHRAEIERIIHRDGTGKTGLAGFVKYKDYRNFIEDSLLTVGSQKLSLFGGRLFHVRRLWEGVFSATFTFTQGTRLLGALKNESTIPGSAKPQFKRMSTDISYLKPFHIVDQEFTFSTQFTAQYTPHTLFSSERISFGGAQTIRGFQETSLNGDVGLYARNDLAWTILDFEHANLKNAFGKPQAFVGFDYGWIRKDKFDTFERGVLRSACVGLRLQGGTVLGQIDIAKAISKPMFLKDEGTVVHLKLGITF
jgi:hemolysin activation/secretion protein